jgi:DNA-binding GntR family transcriptional regulator
VLNLNIRQCSTAIFSGAHRPKYSPAQAAVSAQAITDEFWAFGGVSSRSIESKRNRGYHYGIFVILMMFGGVDMSSVIVRPQSVSDYAFSAILDAIDSGGLIAGQTVHDRDLMDRLQVSRTPVREAVKKAESFGLIEAYASRFTRMVSFTPETALREARVFAAIHAMLVSENWISLQARLSRLETLQRCYIKDVMAGELVSAYQWHRVLIAELNGESPNPSIQLALDSSTYRLRLAEPMLPQLVNPPHLQHLHRGILDALRTNNRAAARKTLLDWAN